MRYGAFTLPGPLRRSSAHVAAISGAVAAAFERLPSRCQNSSYRQPKAVSTGTRQQRLLWIKFDKMSMSATVGLIGSTRRPGGRNVKNAATCSEKCPLIGRAKIGRLRRRQAHFPLLRKSERQTTSCLASHISLILLSEFCPTCHLRSTS